MKCLIAAARDECAVGMASVLRVLGHDSERVATCDELRERLRSPRNFDFIVLFPSLFEVGASRLSPDLQFSGLRILEAHVESSGKTIPFVALLTMQPDLMLERAAKIGGVGFDPSREPTVDFMDAFIKAQFPPAS